MTDAAVKDKRLRVDINDIGQLMDSAPSYVSGTTVDLIRDAHDHPARWLHNSEALPDDRRAAFLVGRGWSATRDAMRRLECSRVPWMAINNYPADGPTPDYWCTGDPPGCFGRRIWEDPAVMKFSPVQGCRDSTPREDYYERNVVPADCPNTHFFHHTYDDPTYHQWLHVPWVNWGTASFGDKCPGQWYGKGAARSSMFVGLRMLWHLGYRVVYLLGCDLTPGQHPAPRYCETITYLLGKLEPTFRRYGFDVYQTNRHSHLRAFRFATLEQALGK